MNHAEVITSFSNIYDPTNPKFHSLYTALDQVNFNKDLFFISKDQISLIIYYSEASHMYCFGDCSELVNHALSEITKLKSLFAPQEWVEALDTILANHSLKLCKGFYCELSSMGCMYTEFTSEHESAVRLAKQCELTKLLPWWNNFIREVRGEEPSEASYLLLKQSIEKNRCYVFAVGDSLRSMAIYKHVTQYGAEVSGVYTPNEFRSLGYAHVIVNVVTKEILQNKKYSYLFIDRQNPVSAHIYQKIGYQKLDDFYFQTFK